MTRPAGPGSGAFTLIELMIVVAVIGILAAIAIPKFSDLVRKSREGATKGNLGVLRSVLNVYYADNEGVYPMGSYSANSTILEDTLVPKYIKDIPESHPTPHHPASSRVSCHYTECGDDFGGWNYFCYQPTNDRHGRVEVMCTHTDTKRKGWKTY